MRCHHQKPQRVALCLAVLTCLVGTQARADLNFTATRAELGEIRSGAKLSHSFAFVNAGPDTVEILEGLNEGDQVILSDMSAWDAFDRVRLN